MEILTLPLSQLQPAPYNPRVELTPKSPRYRKLKRSLEQFGLVEPLVWNRRTGHVVGGHQRLKVVQDLGWKEVPVAVVDLPLEREKALNVVLNNREAQSDWDLPRLREILEEMERLPEPDLASTGFDPAQLEMLRREFTPAESPRVEPLEPKLFEVVFFIPAQEYEEVRSELDAFLAKHPVETHVRCR
jgi:hypothetical protein